MIGSVQSGEAIIPIRVRGPRGGMELTKAVLDTGFNGWLTLSPGQIALLALTFREEAHYLLADGSETTSRLFQAEIEWFGRWRRILVVEMNAEPLLGMAMLAGCRVNVEVVENGSVEIRQLP
jgi:predicted aspartyl protease